MSLRICTLFAVVAVLATATLSLAERVTYDKYRVYKITPENTKQLDVLKKLQRSRDSIIFENGVHIVGHQVDVIVAPHKLPDLLAVLDRENIKYTLATKDLQKAMDEIDEKVATRGSSEYTWELYHELDDTYAWLAGLQDQYPGVVELIVGGQTYENRSIRGVKISKSRSQKPGIFIEAGIHAREWITSAAATFLIHQLLTSKDSSIQQLAENYNWYVLPHVNPDGYVYTHTEDRLWRLTRKPYGNCSGADPNRNWDFHWNEAGASDIPCTETYAGSSPFSEIEIRSLSKYITSLQGKIHLYISFHSFAQLLMYPYGYPDQLPDNFKDFDRVAKAATAAISKRYGTEYNYSNILNLMGPVAGTSIDWVYGTQKVRMAFVYELRPRGEYWGFKLPANQIKPTSEELLDSIIAMVAEVETLGYFNRTTTK